MLRITLLAQSQTEVSLRLDGPIEGEGVALLAREADPHLRQGKRLVLDLDGTSFIDAAGIAQLECWPAGQRVLRGGSMYVRLLLESHGLIP
jgi:hypothetical protein